MPAFRKVNKNQQVTKLNQEVIDKICNNLRLGSFVETAVVMAGVGKKTFYTWIQLSYKRPKSIYAELRHAVELAQAEAETRDLLIIDRCANGQEAEFMFDHNGDIMCDARGSPIVKRREMFPDWSASAWRLERRFGKKWGKIDKLELTGADGGALVTAEETDEEKLKRVDRINDYIKKLAILNGNE